MIDRHFGTHRTFAVTASGLFCLVSASAQVGDHVAVIAGSCYPMTLRATRTGHYSLIQDCYVHGMMNREAARMMDLLKEHASDVEATCASLSTGWEVEEEDALHKNYSRVLSSIGLRSMTLI